MLVIIEESFRAYTHISAHIILFIMDTAFAKIMSFRYHVLIPNWTVNHGKGRATIYLILRANICLGYEWTLNKDRREFPR